MDIFITCESTNPEPVAIAIIDYCKSNKIKARVSRSSGISVKDDRYESGDRTYGYIGVMGCSRTEVYYLLELLEKISWNHDIKYIVKGFTNEKDNVLPVGRRRVRIRGAGN